MRREEYTAAVCLVALVSLGGISAWSQQTDGPEPNDTLVLVNANLVLPSTGRIEASRVVVIRDGRISAIESEAPDGPHRTLDLEGKYLLPGLIDSHVHVGSSGQARKALRSGITTLRSLGVAHYVDVGLRELGSRGVMSLPQVLAAGYHVRPQPGEAFFLDQPELSDLHARGVTGPEAFRRVTSANLERGVDWIKVASTERAGLPQTDPRKQTMSVTELRAVVELAGERSVPVACHAHGDEGGRACVEAGVRSIEHGTYLSRETLTLMRDRGTYLSPTVAVVDDLMQPGGDYDHPDLQVRGRHMFPRLKEVVRTAHELGVKIVASTDTSFRPGSILTLQHEIEALTQCGLSPMEAIRSATTTAAEMLNIEDQTGALHVGLQADLIAVDQNPTEKVSKLKTNHDRTSCLQIIESFHQSVRGTGAGRNIFF